MDDAILRDIRHRGQQLLSGIHRTLDAVDEPALALPRDGWPLWKQFYHLLYWLDHWFVDPLSFVKPAFHEEHFLQPEARSPTVLSKRRLFEYLDAVKARIDRYLADLTIRELAREQEVRGKIRSRLDMMLGQFSHVEHHIGYVCATFRSETGRSIWKDAQERERGIMKAEIRPLSKETLAGFLHFFDDVGFSDNKDWSACYCCFYHHDPARGPWEDRTREGNRNMARELIEEGRMKGFLAYRDSAPVGFCNVNAKSAYALLASDRDLQDADAARTRSIVCFLIAPDLRGRGIARELLESACAGAGNEDFSFLEAYPRKDARTNAAHYHGPLSMYRKAGFTVHKELESYWIVRKAL